METAEFFQGYVGKISLALGFFDCVHLGHQKLIGRMVEDCRKEGVLPAVFTFSNNPYSPFEPGRKQVLTYDERLAKLSALGVELAVHAAFDGAFQNMTCEAFLRALEKNFDLHALYFGADYRFGRGGGGDAGFLEEKFPGKCRRVDFLMGGGEKVSTSRILALLAQGSVGEADRLLGEPYSVSGEVANGYRVGRTMGFPTANIRYPEEKAAVRPAVYLTECEAEGKRYPAITNVGARPTFGDGESKVETYLDGFSGDLYGKTIRIFFRRLLRETRKFHSAEELAAQLQQDKIRLREEQR